jgi:peptidoglycan/LPS O-acetylase OafA/YrhL
MSVLKYRPDIDGLRAVAVLLVLLYHANIEGIGGGYVGVDVFFVISGFLITSLIKNDLERGTFSFWDFWERRIRRILPALAVVTAFTLIVGWFLFLPQDYASLGKQAASQAVFSSNIFFYNTSGYFAAENATKPLLHTWSLAVEEQYYFVIPFLLAGLFAKWRGGMVKALTGLAVVSFIASVCAVINNPEGAFYLLPFRAWELLIGSLLAFAPERPESAHDKKIDNVLAGAGLAAILASGVLYTSKTPFPGAAALLPCLGAAAIIYAGRASHGTYVGRFLSSRPVVFIGLISYSLYLWHWPLLMFAEYVPLFETRSIHRIGLLVLSGVLAYLSWKYIEQPCRKKLGQERRKFVYGSALAGLVLFAAIGLTLDKVDGVKARWPEAALKYSEAEKDRNPRKDCVNIKAEEIRKTGLCQTNSTAGKPRFIAWGDSFSDSAMPIFFALSEKYGVNGYVAARHSCAPILGMRQAGTSKSEECIRFNDAVFDIVKNEKIRHVILIGNWNSWFKIRDAAFVSEDMYKDYKPKFDNTILAAAQYTADKVSATGAQTYVMVGAPILRFNAPSLLAFEEKFKVLEPKSFTPLAWYKSQRERGIERFMDANEGGKITFIDPLPVFCPDDTCIAKHDGEALYFDRNHLTTHGAALVEPLFDPVFKKM